MMETIALKAKPRSEMGKSAVRRVRRRGLVPAVLYGPETNPMNIAVSEHEMKMLLKKGVSTHNPIDLRIEDNGGLAKKVLIRDISYDPVWGGLVHIDFYEIPRTRPIQVLVPIQVKGIPVGVADGGVMQWPVRKLRVECKPDAIPGIIEVDVTPLGKGSSLHASDLPLPPGVKMAEKTDVTIVTVLVPKEEEIPKKPEEVAAAAAAPAEGAAAAAPAEGEAGGKPGEKSAKAQEKGAAPADKAPAAAKPAAKPAKGK